MLKRFKSLDFDVHETKQNIFQAFDDGDYGLEQIFIKIKSEINISSIIDFIDDEENWKEFELGEYKGVCIFHMGEGEKTNTRWRKGTRQYRVSQYLPNFSSPAFSKWQEDTDTHTTIEWERESDAADIQSRYRRGSSVRSRCLV